MRILVTGGAGYIGSHTTALLRARGDFVVVFDSLELGYRQAIGDTPLVVGNTRDGALVKQVIGDHKLEAVIHFAAYKAAGESMTNPAKYFDNNVQGSLQLMEAACQAGVRQFVFSSTAAIYGTPSTCRCAKPPSCTPRIPTAKASSWSSAC
jgi:UDP-glucose 4-epimerase